jgi:hypothetical protein
MDVQEIARRTGLPVRKVRYVLDQRVLPGMRGRPQTHLAGQPRSFTDREGFYIACAAVLLEGGVQRRTVVEVLARLPDLPWPLPGSGDAPQTLRQRAVGRPRSAVEALYLGGGGPALVLIGDAVNLRLQVGGVDTGWLEPRSLARLDEGYRPRVTIQLNLEPLQDAFDPGGGG